MKRLIRKQIIRAARTNRGALNVSIKKYLYLLQLTLTGVKNLPENFLRAEYCGFCERYLRTSQCPFKPGIICRGNCLHEWEEMIEAYDRLKLTAIGSARPTYYYEEFLSNAAQIYVKLMKIKEDEK